MNTYEILKSKPNNHHYLKKYTSFIEACKVKNIGYTKKSKKNPNGIYMEAHHICPKAKDLFPEYFSFKEHQWNKIFLTARQHFIAHWMLWKCFGGSQRAAFWKMCNKLPSNRNQTHKISSQTYGKIRQEHSIATSIQMSSNNPSCRPEVKEMRRIQKLGKPLSEETKRKISQYTRTEQMRKNMSLSHIGIPSHANQKLAVALANKTRSISEKQRYTNAKSVSCEGITFKSLKDAKDFYGCDITKRLTSKKFPTFFRL